MKYNLKGLPSEVAKRMIFEEQFYPNNSNTHPFPISLTLLFTLGGLCPESRDEIPLRGEGCDTPLSPRAFLSANSRAIISCKPN